MGLQKLVAAIFLFVLFIVPLESPRAQSVRPPGNAVNQNVDEEIGIANTLGSNSQSDYWRSLRGGVQGKVSIPDANAGVLVQSEGWRWMLFRNGPMQTFSALAFAIVIALIAIFYLYRGQIKVESGNSGVKILRFGRFARYGHWLNAIAFIVLAITGINMLFGKTILLPLVGPDIFSAITSSGKYIHNWGAFVFILGAVWIFVAFITKNFLSKTMLVGLLKRAGFSKKAFILRHGFLILVKKLFSGWRQLVVLALLSPVLPCCFHTSWILSLVNCRFTKCNLPICGTELSRLS